MIAEILAIGDNLRSGVLVNDNSAFIAQCLEEGGIAVWRHICVGNDPAGLVSVLKEIGHRSDIAVVTGGLGPTEDDPTSAAAAKAAGVDLALNPAALESMAPLLKAQSRPLIESYQKQAILPHGAEYLRNSAGVTPGFRLEIEHCEFFFLPGTPIEMQQMLAYQVLPRISKSLGASACNRLIKTLATFGLTEWATKERLAGFEGLFPHIKLGFRTKFPELQIKLYINAQNEKNLLDSLEKATHWVCRKLGNHVFSETGESLERVVGDLLRKKGATLAVAESCTGGLIANRLTDVPGSSDFFIFSGVTYANQSKIDIIEVSTETLNTHGAVAEQTAKEMAFGVKHISGTTYGLSSGIAGPGGGTNDKPVGTVCIGLATPQSANAHRFNFAFDNRWLNKQIFAATALDLLRRELLGIDL